MRRPAIATALVVLAAGRGGGEASDRAARASAPPPEALANCSSVFYEGAGRPDVLIASDMPLQGTYANDGLQGTKAVQIVLRKRDFTAGETTVGYVSCDGATPRNDMSPAKCRRAGRAYAAARRVVGVIGPFFSSCAIHMMPALNRAGLLEVGPSNTYVGLTRGGPGIPPDQPAAFRPTGRRTYVRLAAPDDLQGRAQVSLARERGERSAYVLYDGVDAYGFPITVLRARAGDAAEGMLITLSAIPTERLTGAGADFLAAFRNATSQNPCCYTVHVAQAADALLDAIAASDGSRASVTAAMLKLRVRDGIIGDFRFDSNGDVSPPLVSAYRVTNGRQKLLDVVENP